MLYGRLQAAVALIADSQLKETLRQTWMKTPLVLICLGVLVAFAYTNLSYMIDALPMTGMFTVSELFQLAEILCAGLALYHSVKVENRFSAVFLTLVCVFVVVDIAMLLWLVEPVLYSWEVASSDYYLGDTHVVRLPNRDLSVPIYTSVVALITAVWVLLTTRFR